MYNSYTGVSDRTFEHVPNLSSSIDPGTGMHRCVISNNSNNTRIHIYQVMSYVDYNLYHVVYTGYPNRYKGNMLKD